MYTKALVFPVSDLIEIVLGELSQKQACTLRVRGSSMFPFLQDYRDLVTLQAFVVKDLKPGAIVLFKYQTKYFLHRIIKKKGANYYLRGDNNWSFCLEKCRAEDIIGVVVAVERNGKSISCDSWWWKLFSYLWVKSHGLRVLLFKLKHI